MAAAGFYRLMRPMQRQSHKIVELKEALLREGYLTLNAQAGALGLGRSTTWTVLRANHKAPGLSASVIARMLRAPQLPPSVREALRGTIEATKRNTGMTVILAVSYGAREEIGRASCRERV